MSEPITEANGVAEATASSEQWYRKALMGLAREIARLEKMEARGDLAALRRIDPNHPTEPALFRIIGRAAPDELMAGPERIRRYAAIMKFMALKPDALRQGGLGKCLQDAGVSGQRLLALLNARGSTLIDVARRTARRLVQAPEVAALPYMELATLILLDGMPSYELATERIRLRIAAEYQRAAYETSTASED
jgi:hypothetical protein